MSNQTSDSGEMDEREKMISAMFASMVIQNTNMAMIFLGLAPNPQTGQTTQELDNARYFIDQLEMIEAKTKGNLNKHEEAIMKQSLTSLRLAFVEAVEHPQTGIPPAGEKADSAASQQGGAAPATDEQETPIVEPALPGETVPPPQPAAAESKKKFTKKY